MNHELASGDFFALNFRAGVIVIKCRVAVYIGWLLGYIKAHTGLYINRLYFYVYQNIAKTNNNSGDMGKIKQIIRESSGHGR
ncbi:hypothetical protein [Parachitinimonas caeni]|uniref:Uncharacterized protein n=1 Tax=Parachitinimonas caeni TaxID=3031301 RepID=A0ABT7DR96_9NEIS|nr:hypothetical protein [Parachitinimonas caeni]MDK2122598.1 hypothetical protein [Parachitinimonas caeni]